MHVLLHSLPPTPQQATTNPRLQWRRGLYRASLGQSLVGSLLLSPGSWCAQVSVCAFQESISQSCVSSGSSVVGLMRPPARGLMPYPSLLHPEPLPLWQSSADLVPPQERLKHSFVPVSVGSLGPGVHKVCLSPLSVSGRNGV